MAAGRGGTAPAASNHTPTIAQAQAVLSATQVQAFSNCSKRSSPATLEQIMASNGGGGGVARKADGRE